MEQRRLARARSTHDRDKLAARNIQIHAAQRMYLDIAHVIDLGQPAHLDHRVLARRLRAHHCITHTTAPRSHPVALPSSRERSLPVSRPQSQLHPHRSTTHTPSPAPGSLEPSASSATASHTSTQSPAVSRTPPAVASRAAECSAPTPKI